MGNGKKILPIIIGGILWQSTTLYAMDMDSTTIVRATQRALNEAGYNCGTPDGISGRNTQNAIKQYQAEKGQDTTGQITEELLISLGFSWDNPYGVSVDTFIFRYNESVAHFNDISFQSGDPSINQISSESIVPSGVLIDEVSEISFGLNTVDTYISSCTLVDKDGLYDVKNLYELSSIAYAMDESYSNPDSALSGITTLFKNYSLTSKNFTCDVLNVGGNIVFSFACINPNEEKVEVEIPEKLIAAGTSGTQGISKLIEEHKYAYARLMLTEGKTEGSADMLDDIVKKRTEYIENKAKEGLITSLNSENATAAVQVAVDEINASVGIINGALNAFNDGNIMTVEELKKNLAICIDDLDNGIISLKTMGDNSSISEIQSNGIVLIENLQEKYWIIIEGLEGDGNLQQDNINNVIVASELSLVLEDVSAWFSTVS